MHSQSFDCLVVLEEAHREGLQDLVVVQAPAQRERVVFLFKYQKVGAWVVRKRLTGNTAAA